MIKINAADLDKQIINAVKNFINAATEKDTKKGIASALYQGGKIIASRARQLAPKAARRKKKSRKAYGRTGLLRRSYTTKKGVTKKGAGQPFAVVGPSKTLKKDIQRGSKTVTIKPSNYAHLVEFGFNVHARVPLVKGRNHERFVKKGVLWKSSTLEEYINKKTIDKSKLSKGKAFRTAAFIKSTGQKSTRVAGQKIVERAYQSSISEVRTVIIKNLGIEIDKAAQRTYLKQVRKYNSNASGMRGVR